LPRCLESLFIIGDSSMNEKPIEPTVCSLCIHYQETLKGKHNGECQYMDMGGFPVVCKGFCLIPVMAEFHRRIVVEYINENN
jgi:hypothetical protein